MPIDPAFPRHRDLERALPVTVDWPEWLTWQETRPMPVVPASPCALCRAADGTVVEIDRHKYYCEPCLRKIRDMYAPNPHTARLHQHPLGNWFKEGEILRMHRCIFRYRALFCCGCGKPRRGLAWPWWEFRRLWLRCAPMRRFLWRGLV